MLGKAGEGLHLPSFQFFLLRRLRIPGRNLLGPRGQFRALRNDAHLLLARKRLFAERVPPLIEFALVSRDVFLRNMMRRMQSPRGKVDEEGLVWSQRVLRL